MNTEEKKQSRLTKKQKRNILIAVIVLAVMILADFVWSNTYIEVKKLSAHFDNLPEGFEGCKIVQISDFHNEWGKGYIDRLTEKVKENEPDYIFVTGDSVDQIFPDVDRSLEFMKKLPDICPVYLVMGNHVSDMLVYFDAVCRDADILIFCYLPFKLFQAQRSCRLCHNLCLQYVILNDKQSGRRPFPVEYALYANVTIARYRSGIQPKTCVYDNVSVRVYFGIFPSDKLHNNTQT